MEFRHEDSHISKKDLSNIQVTVCHQLGQNQVNGFLQFIISLPSDDIN